MSSNEGYQWTQANGLEEGLPTQGVVSLAARSAKDIVYDVIVAGAGYAGLVAARDLALQSTRTPFRISATVLLIRIIEKKVLLLEARDRVGGRTWSTNLDGYHYEMGGTWVHWNQPHVYAEISRYNMANELLVSQDFSQGSNYFTLVTEDGAKRHLTHEKEVCTATS